MIILNKHTQKCAGKACKKWGIRKLRVVFVNKVGLFCDDCANSLLELKIASIDNEESVKDLNKYG